MTTQKQAGALKLLDSGDANSVQLQAPATQAASVTYTFPAVPASTGLTLTSTTGGVTSWTAAGGLTLGAVGASPNANGALLTGNTLTLEPASASFPGVATIGAQTIAGTKTFTSPVTLLDTSDAHIVALQAPSTQAGSVTYTVPTTPASTGLNLTSTTGGVMSWAAGTVPTGSFVAGYNHTPADGSTINYTVGGITPTWCAAYAVNGTATSFAWSDGWCTNALSNQCITTSANSVATYGVVTFANLINLGGVGNVTNFSANNISIQWSNPSAVNMVYVLFAHA
jgi:hypothetical protein